MTDQVYSADQVLSVVGKISERDEWTGEERALLGTILASGVEQYRESLSADAQATFDAEVAELSGDGVEDDEVEGFLLLGPSLLLANLVTKTVTSTSPPLRCPFRPAIRRIEKEELLTLSFE